MKVAFAGTGVQFIPHRTVPQDLEGDVPTGSANLSDGVECHVRTLVVDEPADEQRSQGSVRAYGPSVAGVVDAVVNAVVGDDRAIAAGAERHEVLGDGEGHRNHGAAGPDDVPADGVVPDGAAQTEAGTERAQVTEVCSGYQGRARPVRQAGSYGGALEVQAVGVQDVRANLLVQVAGEPSDAGGKEHLGTDHSGEVLSRHGDDPRSRDVHRLVAGTDNGDDGQIDARVRGHAGVDLGGDAFGASGGVGAEVVAEGEDSHAVSRAGCTGCTGCIGVVTCCTGSAPGTSRRSSMRR